MEPASSVPLLEAVIGQTLNHLQAARSGAQDTVVTRALTPDAVLAKFPEAGDLREDARESIDEVQAVMKKALELSVNTSCKRFCNQLYAEPDPVGLAAAQVTSVANCSLATFEMSPVFSTCERELVTKLVKLVGWDPSEGEGIFCPGGSHCNHTAMLAARNSFEPDSKLSGLAAAAARGQGPLVAFASKDCHYSIQKGANLIGIGQDGAGGLVTVDIDKNGSMSVEALRAAVVETIEEGKRPFLVVATAGTTVRGCYDPIASIAALCSEFGMWLHVDGALGASVVFSESQRHRLAGLEHANSLTWDAHKMLGVPLQCAVLLMRKQVLKKSNNCDGIYLFKDATLQQVAASLGDRFGTVERELAEQKMNLGEMSLQCGRIPDSFKWWAMWFVHGEGWFTRRVDKLEVLRRHFITKVKESSTLHLAENPEGLSVLFYALPQQFLASDGSPDLSTPEARAKVAYASQATRRLLLEQGKWMVNYQETNGVAAPCFRMVFLNPALTTSDMDELVSDISSIVDKHLSDERQIEEPRSKEAPTRQLRRPSVC